MCCPSIKTPASAQMQKHVHYQHATLGFGEVEKISQRFCCSYLEEQQERQRDNLHYQWQQERTGGSVWLYLVREQNTLQADSFVW